MLGKDRDVLNFSRALQGSTDGMPPNITQAALGKQDDELHYRMWQS